MRWPESRPGFVPEAVWEFAKELHNGGNLTPGEALALSGLLTPDMARTWEGLARRGVTDERSWRLLLDMFVTSGPAAALDRGLRPALARSAEILPEVTEKAWELLALIEEYRALALRHGITAPAECEDRDTLAALAAAAQAHEPVPRYPHQAYGTTGKAGLVTEWVRAIDSRFILYYAPLILPEGLCLADSDLARVGCAVLGLAVNREAAKKARADTPPHSPSETVLFF